MPEPPRRKRYQIHLSTAIVMMFVAGALISANAARRDTIDDYHEYEIYGWPCDALTLKTSRDFFPEPFIPRKWKAVVRFWSRKNTVFDVLTAFAILVVVWLLCERLIRRRAARKAP